MKLPEQDVPGRGSDTYLPEGAGASIGEILVAENRLSDSERQRVLRLQKARGERFGDLACELGLAGPDDIRHALARQFGYPCFPEADHSLSPELLAVYEPQGAVAEQLRSLRSEIMLQWSDPSPHSNALAIVSPGEGEGRSFIAANLAVVFAQLGERTLLIDADLRNPRQHVLFRLGRVCGLSEVLAGRARAEQVIARIPRLHRLSVLPAGAVPPNPQELLGRQLFARELYDLRSGYDVVIVDTPPASRFADARMVASRTGAALIVARRHRSSLKEMTQLKQRLDAHVPMLGAVLNDA